MFKILVVVCTLAAVIYGLPANEEVQSLVTNKPSGIAVDPKPDQPAHLVDGNDTEDLVKSETFGFGYKHYYPRSYGYHSYYYYPRYYHYRPWYYKRYYW